MDAKKIATNREYRKDAWLIGGEVYLAPADAQLDTQGFPLGARWESSLNHWNHYFDAVQAPRGWKKLTSEGLSTEMEFLVEDLLEGSINRKDLERLAYRKTGKDYRGPAGPCGRCGGTGDYPPDGKQCSLCDGTGRKERTVMHYDDGGTVLSRVSQAPNTALLKLAGLPPDTKVESLTEAKRCPCFDDERFECDHASGLCGCLESGQARRCKGCEICAKSVAEGDPYREESLTRLVEGRQITRTFKTLAQAEQYQNSLYNQYDSVRLVRSPRFSEEGTYVWEVGPEGGREESLDETQHWTHGDTWAVANSKGNAYGSATYKDRALAAKKRDELSRETGEQHQLLKSQPVGYWKRDDDTTESVDGMVEELLGEDEHADTVTALKIAEWLLSKNSVTQHDIKQTWGVSDRAAQQLHWVRTQSGGPGGKPYKWALGQIMQILAKDKPGAAAVYIDSIGESLEEAEGEFTCLECGKVFKTAAAAERASRSGCPKCGGVDIDLNVKSSGSGSRPTSRKESLDEDVNTWPFESGPTQIWYMKPSYFRNGIMGAEFLRRTDPARGGGLPDPDNLKATHVLLGTMRSTNPEEIFDAMQAHHWASENPQATNQFLSSKGAQHTSMSVGDVAVINGRAMMVDRFGWVDLGKDVYGESVVESDFSDTLAAFALQDKYFSSEAEAVAWGKKHFSPTMLDTYRPKKTPWGYRLATEAVDLLVEDLLTEAAQGTVGNFLTVFKSLLTQYDQKQSNSRGYNRYALGHYFDAFDDAVEPAVSGVAERDDSEALTKLKQAVLRGFHADFPPVVRLFKQIDAWEKTKTPPTTRW